ncbi:unnamed protein product [Symbiodinium sp. CCMP2456]|nr:unnamed protein product [Symbiodinium sp. CCMP2456]
MPFSTEEKQLHRLILEDLLNEFLTKDEDFLPKIRKAKSLLGMVKQGADSQEMVGQDVDDIIENSYEHAVAAAADDTSSVATGASMSPDRFFEDGEELDSKLAAPATEATAGLVVDPSTVETQVEIAMQLPENRRQAAQEKRPPVHVRPTDMPQELQEQAELQLKLLSASPVAAAAKAHAEEQKVQKKQNKGGKKKTPAAQTEKKDNGVKKDKQNKKKNTAAETPAAAEATRAAGTTKKPADLSSSWLDAAVEIRRAGIPIPDGFHGDRPSFTAQITGTDSKATIIWQQRSIYVKKSKGCKDEKVNVDGKGGSWVFMSCSVHKRQPDDGAYGDTNRTSVRTANLIATRTALLLLLAYVLDVEWIIEQPGGSVLRFFKPLLYVIQNCQPSVYFKKFYLACYGHFAPKSTWLLGTSAIVKKFDRKLSKRKRKELRDRQLEAGANLVIRTVGQDGVKKVRAAPPLKWSEHYPSEFCTSIVKYKDELEMAELEDQQHIIRPDDDDPDRLQFRAEVTCDWSWADLTQLEDFLHQEELQGRWKSVKTRDFTNWPCLEALASSTFGLDLAMSDASQELDEVARAALAAGQRRQAAAKLLLQQSAKAAVPAASPAKAKDPPMATPMKDPTGKRAREPRSSPANTVTPSTKTPDAKQIKTEDVTMTPKKTLFDEGISKGLSTGSLGSEIATPAVVRQVAMLNKGASEPFLDTVPDDPDILEVCKDLQTQMTLTVAAPDVPVQMEAKQISGSASKNSGPSDKDAMVVVVPSNDEAKQIPDSASKNSGPSATDETTAVVPPNNDKAKQIPDSASKDSGPSATDSTTAVVPNNDEAKQIPDSASKNSGPSTDTPALQAQLQQASQLLQALQQVAPGATQASLLRPGTIDFAELIQQMQSLQASEHGGSGSTPDHTISGPDATSTGDDVEKVESMPPPSSIPVKRAPEVLPATRDNSPAPPSLVQRAAAAEPIGPEVQEDLAAAEKDIQASWGK